MVDPGTGWFKIAEYNDKRSIIISKSVETVWLNRYIWSTKSHMTKYHNLLFVRSENFSLKNNTGYYPILYHQLIQLPMKYWK